MAEVDDDGWYECEVCGKRRHVNDRCGGGGRHATLEGWNPELVAGARDRLPLTGRPAGHERSAPAEAAE